MAIDHNHTSATASNENRLPGAYIRGLVKQQLSTSKPLNTTQNLINNNDRLNFGEFIQASTSTKKGDKLGMTKVNNQQEGHKKQVRRRLHTSRPYQERLLNMAEARKEIVTALKYHRASMKKANERNQRPQDEQHVVQVRQQHHHQSIFGVQDYNQSRRAVKLEPSTENYSYSSFPSQTNNNNNNNQYSSTSSSYNWGICSSQHQPTCETLNNISLPNQTLGLNLNLQAFTNLDTSFCHSINTTYNNNNTNNHHHHYSSSSSMSPSSSSSSTPRDLGVAAEGGVPPLGGSFSNGMDMHPSLDEAEMAVINSIGEQHQIEWDDTLNLVKSAWWFKYLKTVEFGKEMKGESFDHLPFREVNEFPPWLSANNDDSVLQHLDDSSSKDTTLPWMDIGDIDGLDDEWLS